MSEDNDVRGSLATALALVQSKLPEIPKAQKATVPTKAGGTYSYTYADLANVTKMVLPLLGDTGLAWMTKPTMHDGKFVLHYKLLHISGEFEEGYYPLPDSGTPQAIGSAITYARRYCLCSVTGVAPEDDDDAAAAEPQTNTARRQQQTAQRAARPAGNGQRTAQRARPAGPPLPGEDDGPRKASEAQRTKLHAIYSKHGIDDPHEQHEIAGRLVGRSIGSSKELSLVEASKLISRLENVEQTHGDMGTFLVSLATSADEKDGEPDEDGRLM